MNLFQKFRDREYNRRMKREIKKEFAPYHAQEQRNEDTLRAERQRNSAAIIAEKERIQKERA
jgi:hypothetical protein